MSDLLGKYSVEITWLLSIIILGAIGTALWDIILKPSSSWFLRRLLSVLTFGLNRAKITIYKRISLKEKESFSKYLASYFALLVLSGTIILSMILILYTTNSVHEIRNNILSLEKQNKELILPPKISANEKKEQIKKEIIQIRNKIRQLKAEISKNTSRLITYSIIIVFISFFLALMILIEFLFLLYISNAVGYFDQLLTICRPFINETDYIQYLSDFACIKSPQDYKKIIENLHKVAKDREIDVPGFWVW